ncbi:hypothetical protein BaRGS_00012582 [Batillaria attramentaria]|uniref:Uncharacterized protein n=1 Tax=Batillaria attramentaria TaxID=370345 RepID=A0ABD0L9K0_9CAEN
MSNYGSLKLELSDLYLADSLRSAFRWTYIKLSLHNPSEPTEFALCCRVCKSSIASSAVLGMLQPLRAQSLSRVARAASGSRCRRPRSLKRTARRRAALISSSLLTACSAGREQENSHYGETKHRQTLPLVPLKDFQTGQTDRLNTGSLMAKWVMRLAQADLGIEQTGRISRG